MTKLTYLHYIKTKLEVSPGMEVPLDRIKAK